LSAAARAKFEGLYAAGLSFEKQGQFAEAAQQFESAAGIDPHHAELQFRWASSLVRITNAAAARGHYQSACDNDALPFRADSRVNELIKKAAQLGTGKQFVLCDAEAALHAHSPVNIAGEESFFEHVHFNFNGNYWLGLAWAEQLATVLGLATNPAP